MSYNSNDYKVIADGFNCLLVCFSYILFNFGQNQQTINVFFFFFFNFPSTVSSICSDRHTWPNRETLQTQTSNCCWTVWSESFWQDTLDTIPCTRWDNYILSPYYDVSSRCLVRPYMVRRFVQPNDFVIFFLKRIICCRYSLEAPCRGASNKHLPYIWCATHEKGPLQFAVNAGPDQPAPSHRLI